jgi:D-alanyl-lipoteichoic acid acyltransferase DltB (MBOAT superfamily)
VVLTGQLSTMLLIGLWHGITGILPPGVWHGVGLFIHGRWTGATCARFGWQCSRDGSVLLAVSGTLITFHYVVLGWVWFAYLP